MDTDINSIVIDEENSTVFISDPMVRLDVGAIAKGYAVEMVAKALEQKGVTGYILNVGGNVRSIGTKGNGDKWIAGIQNPNKASEVKYLEYLAISGESVVTSGSYQRYYTVEGKDYHHIIDPETLMPSDKFVSVSIVCRDSGLGDALSTALFCMSYEDGLALVESLEGVEAHWVFPDYTTAKSSGFSAFVTTIDN